MPSRLRLVTTLVVVSITFLLAFVNVYAQDENYVVYLDIESNLYSVPASGGDPVRLSAEEVPVSIYNIIDSGSVIFKGVDDILYSVPVTGGNPTALIETPLAALENNYQISSDGNWIVYLARQADGAIQLYSVSTAGGDSVALVPDNQTLYFNPYEISTFYFITANSSSVVFTAQSARGVFNLFAAPIEGGEAVQLNDRLASGGHVISVYVHEDIVVYLADQTADEVYGLFVTSLAGGESMQLNASDARLIPNNRYAITPDGNYLIYQSYSTSDSQLFSVPIEGGDAIAITDPIDNMSWYMSPATGTIAAAAYNILRAIVTPSGESFPVDTGRYGCCIFSPDGQRLLLMSWAPGVNSGSGDSLYSYSIDSGEAVPLTIGNLPLGRAWAALFSPNNAHVVFLQTDENGINQFYTAPADGSSPAIQLNAYPGTVYFGNYQMGVTADSSTVIYINDEEAEDFSDIYSVPITGGEAIRLTPDDSPGVQLFRLYPRASVWRTG